MAEKGAVSQSCITELVEYIENLKQNRDEIHSAVVKEKQEKDTIHHDIDIFERKLEEINASLAKKYSARAEFDKSISEVESAF